MQILFCLVSCALKRQVVVLVEIIFWKLTFSFLEAGGPDPAAVTYSPLTVLFRS